MLREEKYPMGKLEQGNDSWPVIQNSVQNVIRSQCDKKKPKKQKSQPIWTNFNVHYILIFQLKVVFVASAFSLAHNQIGWRFGTLV